MNYFCSVLGPTYPNRFYLASGTSGGITTNGIWGFGVLDWPCILDLLEDAGISWKVYNLGAFDNVPAGDSDNVFVFFKRFAHDHRARASTHDYLARRPQRDAPERLVPDPQLHARDRRAPAGRRHGRDGASSGR